MTDDPTALGASLRRYNAFLLLVAGLGGLLYGIDVGIIGGALPYLEATSHLSLGQLSVIVAAVLLGGVFSTLFAGLLADWMGRKKLMILSGLTFVVSIPVIALSSGFMPLFWGRLLQGVSAGLVGIVVPLYLAECLEAKNRGKGTGAFQWLLTLGIVVAALVGIYYSYRVTSVAQTATASALFQFKDQAWRRIFWVSLPPGLFFVLGSLLVAESPRWLYRRGQVEEARAALLRSRTPEQAEFELEEMATVASVAEEKKTGAQAKDSLLRRKYVIPFLLACAILFLNQGTGINSIIGYNTGILLQSGLSDLAAHWGYVAFTCVNFLLTMVGMSLVDKRGRRFLILFGLSGIIASLLYVGVLFVGTERQTVNVAPAVQAMLDADPHAKLTFDRAASRKLLAGQTAIDPDRASLEIIYSYGDFTAATNFVRSDDSAAAPIEIDRASSLPSGKIDAFFKNPTGNLAAAQTAPLRIQKAIIAPIPSAQHGWLVALGLYAFIASYAFGPGVVVWLALSELMPTRIRSNGMSIALVLNQLLSAILAGIFLPFVGRWGYSSIFFLFAGFTVVYIAIAGFFLPETKGKTLEEIEAVFEGQGRRD
jgi:MFS transporter, SP family, solute carrier family 2 (myo-inositol transporter), member 13